MIKVIRQKKLIHDFWIDKIRKIRNPITHIRYTGDPDCADIRSYQEGHSMEEQLHLEAKDALEVATHPNAG